MTGSGESAVIHRRRALLSRFAALYKRVTPLSLRELTDEPVGCVILQDLEALAREGWIRDLRQSYGKSSRNYVLREGMVYWHLMDYFPEDTWPLRGDVRCVELHGGALHFEIG